jgi:hypothetical protein
MRGNPNTSKDIFKSLKKGTGNESVPVRENSSMFGGYPTDMGGGAFNSMRKKQRVSTPENTPTKEIVKVIENPKLTNYFDSINESLDLLHDTKDYSTVIRGLLTCYISGKLSKLDLSQLDREDKLEIKGIIEDFKNSVGNSLI